MSTRAKIVASVIFGVVVIAAIGSGGTPTTETQPPAAPTTPTDAPSAAAAPSVAPKPTAKATVAPAAEPEYTVAQQNAIEKAQDYLGYTAFSRTGLIAQLEYEGFARADATFAVDSLDVGWEEQAYQKGLDYLGYSSFSLSGLIAQLEYEGFTKSQAKYGATKAYGD